ncbi:PDZ domain-containing protein [Fontivita pretiosa]|uniref:PDZ domain-containing protein n=1 Tax=Fontivita pretiosa TaxID=2989684 RepID=UPI003D1646CC
MTLSHLHKSIAALLTLLGLVCVSLGAVDPQLIRDIHERATPSLVVVQYTYEGELGRRELHAAGIVVGDDGLVIASGTFTPVQIPDEQMTEFKIIIPGDDQTEIDADFLGRDDRTNIAFIKARPEQPSPSTQSTQPATAPRAWTPLRFEDVALAVGEPVICVGLLPKDAGYRSYVTAASVSALLRGPVPQVLVSGEGLCAVGSPVFDGHGRAVGIVHAQENQSPFLNDPREPMAPVFTPPRLFVPASDFLLSLNDPPVKGQPLKYPHIGVAQLSGLKKEVAEYFGLENQPAVQVGDVISGFPADKAGLKRGDIIVKVNGQPLERGDDPDETPLIMTRKIARMKVGQDVTFTVVRGRGQPPREITVTLEERPMQANKAKRFFAEDLGFTARQIVFEDTYVRRLPSDTRGVVVALVKPNSSAQTAKLQHGDLITRLNQSTIESLDDFKSQYQTFRKEQPREAVVLEVLRGVNTQIIRIEPPQ